MNDFADSYMDYHLEDKNCPMIPCWIMYIYATFVVGLILFLTNIEWILPFTPPLCVSRNLSEIVNDEDEEVEEPLNIVYEPYDVFQRHRNRRYIDDDEDDIFVSTTNLRNRMRLEDHRRYETRDIRDLPFDEDILKMGYEFIGIPSQQLVNNGADIE